MYQSSDVVLCTDLDIADDMATVRANGMSTRDMQDITVADLFPVVLAKLCRVPGYPPGARIPTPITNIFQFENDVWHLR